MVAAIKKSGGRIGHVDVGRMSNGNWYISIENNLQFSDEMHDFISASPRARLVKRQDHEGSFDWASDTYMKDSSDVEFKF